MRHTHFGPWGHHEPYGHLPPFRFWLQQNLPTVYDDSLTYLELASRLNWYIEQIINTLKVYDDKFCELMGLYKELECYVNDYFSSVDFPAMVKDILDDMAATGKLGELLIAYINDYSIDAKKIKGGIVPVHYTYDHTENGIEVFKREESDKDVLDILINGSAVMGFFKNSPTGSTFISYMTSATWEHNGTVKEFECGCVNTVYTNDFTITYEDFFVDDTDTIHRMKITDHYGDTPKMEVFPVYMDIRDGSVTTPKLVDKVVTHPKLDDDAVWENNIKDGSVTLPKLAKPYTIFIGDDYDSANGGWISKAVAAMNIGSSDYNSASANGAGFVGSGTTYLAQLQSAAAGLSADKKKTVGAIVIAGGYNDRDKDITSAAASLESYITANFPNAKVYLGMIAWKCNAIAGGHKYDTGYLPLVENYVKVAGDHGWAFMDNLQYVMHDYRLFDSTGLKPNANGCAELGRAVAITLAGGTYNVHKVGHMLNVTAASNINVEPTSQNNLFGESGTAATKMQQLVDNGYLTIRINDFHCIEFKTATDLLGHMTGTTGYTGEFDVFTFDVAGGYFEGAEWHGLQYYPCSVKNSSGAVVNASIGLRLDGNKLKAHLYKATENTPSGGIRFETFDDVKFIHWGQSPVFIYDAAEC